MLELRLCLVLAILCMRENFGSAAPPCTASSKPLERVAKVARTSGDFVLDFGKHKGLSLSKVPLLYLKWLKTVVTKPRCHDAVERLCSELAPRCINHACSTKDKCQILVHRLLASQQPNTTIGASTIGASPHKHGSGDAAGTGGGGCETDEGERVGMEQRVDGVDAPNRSQDLAASEYW